MKFGKLLYLLAVVCCLASCSLENEDVLFKEPFTQWGASKSAVKSYMKGYTIVDDEDEDYLSYLDIKTRKFLPYTLMYDYEFDVEYVPDAETMSSQKVDRGLDLSMVYVMGTTQEQQKALNEEFLAFFQEKYTEVPLSSFPDDYWDEGEEYEEDDMDTELLAASKSDDGSLCIVIGVIKDLNNCIAASYSYEF